MLAACNGWRADGCVVPKGGIETCTIDGEYYYNQQDLRWRNTPLTCANTTTTYFVQNGCGEIAVSMLLSRYISPSYNPPKVLSSLFKNYCGPTKFDDDIQILQNNGFTRSVIDNTMNSLKQYIQIRPGWTAFILLDIDGKEHFTIANRISSDGHVLFDDPWYGAGVDYSGHTIDFKNIDIVIPTKMLQ
jgi:hypothetical protein